MLTGPRKFAVERVPAPSAAPGEAVVDVERVGVCGTDIELYSGKMAYIEQGHSSYPLRLGHEWCGLVTAVGDDFDAAWVGRRVMGDTMIGCGNCRRCRRGNQHVCEFRGEVGVRDGRPGALAEQISVPVSSLHELPASVDPALGALVEPGGNSLRSARATEVGPGDRVLVLGPGTIGLLVGMFLRVQGAEVHLMGQSEPSLDFARTIGFENCWTEEQLPGLPFDAIVECSNAPHLPGLALDLVEPGGRLVYVGLAPRPSLIDSRALALKDVKAVGILSASPGLDATIKAFASGEIDPRPLVAATVRLEEVGSVLAGDRPLHAGPGPKLHVDPRL